MKRRVALLYGGASSEHEVSVLGYKYMARLLKEKCDLLPVYIDKDGCWSAQIDGENIACYPARGLGLMTERGATEIDAAIPLLHGDGGEDGTLQGALACAGIPYVGADVITSAVCIDKTYTKRIADSLGIPTLSDVSFTGLTPADEARGRIREALGFPIFLKPRRLGSSVGAYPVRDDEDLSRLYPLSQKVGEGLVMAEKMLTKKRELECAFCEYGGERIITHPGEILVDGFYGYGEKYGGKTKTAPRADIPDSVAALLTEYARALADAVGLRHLGRIDFFLTDEEVYFNEINTFPGFTDESLYPKMLASHGIDVTRALLSFIEDAISC